MFSDDNFGNGNITSERTFLDHFKNDPKLRTIYFTSKDLVFSYKNSAKNIMSLGFDMKQSDYIKAARSDRRLNEKYERPATAHEKRNAAREFSGLKYYVTESYWVILSVLFILMAALYLSFRYVLNRHI